MFRIINFTLLVLVSTFFLLGCQSKTSEETEKKQSTGDLHSFANYHEIHFKHLSLDLAVSFDQKQISGTATWFYEKINKSNNYIILDTRDLFVEKVLDQNGEILRFELGDVVEHLGQSLIIDVKDSAGAVQIFYKTKPSSEALQWLEAEQTFGKKQPFLYTQSETIYARSWIPTPDGPGVRFTYDATVEVPKGMMALMSATNPQSKNANGIYQFQMEQEIPAYLLALAVGDVQFKAINDRTGVYAESSILEKSWNEFKEIDKMVDVAESLYGPYKWGRYDMLVLPFGFPFGGMENPILTFLTPTIISGDRTLLNLIAHELAHSWSGNLVTNKTWEDFWLNEGFTVYFERRITEAIHGKDYVDMLWSLALQDLKASIDFLPERDTWLKLDLKDRHPDVGLTDIPYDKGALFLRKVEETIGREHMDKFLIQYFEHFAFQTISTEEFIDYFKEHVLKDHPDWAKEINIKGWIYGPGLPDNHPTFEVKRFEAVNESITKSLETPSHIAAIDHSEWSTYEYLHFLKGIQKDAHLDLLEAIEKEWHLTDSENMEILCVWLEMSIEQEYKPAYARLDLFLNQVGRMKFLEPLYDALKKSSLGALGTQKLYEQKSHNYHPIARMEIEHILNMK